MADDKRLEIDIDVRKTGSGDTDAAAALSQVKDAASQAKQSLDGLDQPILQGVAQSAPEAAAEIAKAGEAAETAGGAFENANPNLSRFREALGGISQMSSGDTSGQLVGLGRVVESLGKAVGAPSLQLAALAGAIGVAVKAAQLLSEWAAEGGPKVTLSLGDIGEASATTAAEIKKLSEVKLDVSSLLENLDKLKTKYAETRDTAKLTREVTADVARARDALANAELDLEKQKALATASTDEERAAIEAIFVARGNTLKTMQDEAELQRQVLETQLGLKALDEDRNRILVARKALVEDLKRKQEEEDEKAPKSAYSPLGAGLGLVGDARRSTARRETAERDLATFDQEADPELDDIANKAETLTSQWQALNIRMKALQVESESVDVTQIDSVKIAIDLLTKLLADSSTAVADASSAGTGLQEALERQKALQDRLSTLRPDHSQYTPPSDGSEVVPITPIKPEVVSVLGDSIAGAGYIIHEAAEQAAPVVEEGGKLLSDAMRDSGTAAGAAATEAAGQVKEAEKKVSRDLSGGATVIQKEADNFSSATAGGVREMTASMKSMKTEVVSILKELTQEIAITRLEARQAMAASRTALAQIENMG